LATKVSMHRPPLLCSLSAVNRPASPDLSCQHWLLVAHRAFLVTYSRLILSLIWAARQSAPTGRVESHRYRPGTVALRGVVAQSQTDLDP
jgi:hypothetical protein